MDISQRELADRLNVSEATVSRYLAGEREPKYDMIANIATALQTTVNYLMGENPDEYSFPKVKLIISRNAGQLTKEEKKELINIILEG